MILRLILRRIGLGLVAASILAASAAVCVVALAFALYALVEPDLGRAGAAAVVAGSAALLIGLVGAAVAVASRPKAKPGPPATAAGLADRVMQFVRDKPVVSIGAALGAGFMAVRNPRYVGAAIRSFLDDRETPGRRR